MPKMPDNRDRAVLDTVVFGMENAPSLFGRELNDSPTKRFRLLGMLGFDKAYVARFGVDGMVSTALRDNREERRHMLDSFARSQTFELLHAGHMVAQHPDLDLSQAQQVIALKNMRSFGRLFGHVKAIPAGNDTSSDWKMVEKITHAPATYIQYEPATNSLVPTPVAREHMRPLMGKTVGCPALEETVVFEGEKLKLFDVAWDAYAEDYTNLHIIQGLEYVKPSIFLADSDH